MKLICFKPSMETRSAAYFMSGLLQKQIKESSNWHATQSIMHDNHRLMCMFGWFKPDYGFVEFKDNTWLKPKPRIVSTEELIAMQHARLPKLLSDSSVPSLRIPDKYQSFRDRMGLDKERFIFCSDKPMKQLLSKFWFPDMPRPKGMTAQEFLKACGLDIYYDPSVPSDELQFGYTVHMYGAECKAVTRTMKVGELRLTA